MLWEEGGSRRGGGHPVRLLRRKAEQSPYRARVRGWADAGSREEGGEKCGPRLSRGISARISLGARYASVWLMGRKCELATSAVSGAVRRSG